ncbi:MAG: tyrosine-type recombinase/integrase [Anaerolineales bacterium]|nr:tyrosine-type recombinase/integrase [Anaerolineales bacterium]
MQNNANSISSQSHGAKTKSLEVLVRVVLNSLPSASSKRVYKMSIRDFLAYWQSEGEPKLDKLSLQTYIVQMQNEGVGEASINLRLAAIRKLAREAVEMNIWPEEVAAAFASVKNIPQRGKRTGNWLSLEQSQELVNAPDISTNIGLRDRALLAVLIGCGIRRQELTKLKPEQLQLRDDRWVIANLVGKRNKARTVTVPAWVMQAIDAYIEACDIQSGRLFQAMSKSGRILHEYICGETVRDVVYKYAQQCGLDISPHDLRRTYAKLAHKNGAKIDQIQLNLGHHSLATTQVYLGNDLDLKNGPGDFLDINIE